MVIDAIGKHFVKDIIDYDVFEAIGKHSVKDAINYNVLQAKEGKDCANDIIWSSEGRALIK